MLACSRGLVAGPGLALLGTLLLLGSACQPNDLGSPCELSRPVCYADCDDPENADIQLERFEPEDRTRDYISTGVMDCEHFTCVSSAGHHDLPYCTRSCLGDEQCQGGVRPDLVCRELVLDDQFIADLCEQIGEERCEEIFGQIKGSKYCVAPLEE